ncbi:Diaminopimelate epimerase, DapF,Diaminopimelate epimerase, active site [Cinara cedri]|uniref:diaminopimelate epimerase n=1 Tax=Cinara cedri TaxID=506608 RepID=A0A5E4NTR4_9HEMI|nr:Diaminopimelate epimerase, DapF,Diaminopimelate epimerase, active site [Cinara cedri]
MHGSGNNFVIIDSRLVDNANRDYREIANDSNCDQVIVVTNSNVADCFMHIYNADGSKVETCGNAARCVGYLIMLEKSTEYATIELMNERILECFKTELGVLKDPVAVNIGNPHMIFFVNSIEKIPLLNLAPQLETHILFPKKTNVSITQIDKSGEINLQVWERGTGITASCGSAACAAFVASVLRGYITAQQTSVNFLGGNLSIEWKDNVFMTGDVEFIQ